MHDGRFLRRCVADISALLLGEEAAGDSAAEDVEEDTVRLWDGGAVDVESGYSYADESEE